MTRDTMNVGAAAGSDPSFAPWSHNGFEQTFVPFSTEHNGHLPRARPRLASSHTYPTTNYLAADQQPSDQPPRRVTDCYRPGEPYNDNLPQHQERGRQPHASTESFNNGSGDAQVRAACTLQCFYPLTVFTSAGRLPPAIYR